MSTATEDDLGYFPPEKLTMPVTRPSTKLIKGERSVVKATDRLLSIRRICYLVFIALYNNAYHMDFFHEDASMLSINQSISLLQAIRPINTQTHKPIGRQTHTYSNREIV